jgi:hypothetical protein
MTRRGTSIGRFSPLKLHSANSVRMEDGAHFIYLPAERIQLSDIHNLCPAVTAEYTA